MENNKMTVFKGVTRLEVIDSNGRAGVFMYPETGGTIKLSLQDGEKTLKVFVTCDRNLALLPIQIQSIREK